MNTISDFILVCAGLAVGSISSASPLDADKQAIEATLKTVVEAWDRSDAKAIASVYAQDGDLIVPDGTLSAGKPMIEAFYKSAFSRGYAGTAAGAHIVRGRRVGSSSYIADGTWSIDGIKHAGKPTRARLASFRPSCARKRAVAPSGATRTVERDEHPPGAVA